MSKTEEPRKVSDEAIKFVMWAIGIGAGSTMAIIAYAHANFVTKEFVAISRQSRDKEITELQKAVIEIKTDNKELQKWLRDNWHKRKIED